MRGATPSRILEQLKLAIEGSYRASGNKDTELDKALLVTAIASRLLPMLNQENGFGTEDSIKKTTATKSRALSPLSATSSSASSCTTSRKQIFSSLTAVEMCLWY